jgi:hypothetical protein
MRNRIIYWLLVLVFQFLVLNHLGFSAFIIPQAFIVLLITLPLSLGKTTQVLIAFGLGIVADLFVATSGIHASASLWLIVLRIMILSRQDLKQQMVSNLPYNMKSVGVLPFLNTTLILVPLYHFYIFWIQNIGAIHWKNYFIASGASSILAITILITIQYLSFRGENER